MREAEAALRFTRGLQKKNHASYKRAKAIQYWQQTGRTASRMGESFKQVLETALGGFDDTVKQALQAVDFMSGTEVKQLMDKLSQRVYDLEQGIGATTQFQMVTDVEGPDDVNAAYHK